MQAVLIFNKDSQYYDILISPSSKEERPASL